MSIEQALIKRSNQSCELCSAKDNLSVYEIPPTDAPSQDHSIYLCQTCLDQVKDETELQPNHWHCLNDAMWSQVTAVQVMSWRMLKKLSSNELWAQDQLDMLYLDDETLAWAQAGQSDEDSEQKPTLDSNGTPLAAGDTVVVIKDLVVKGAGFTAKRGTAVRNISLTNNPEHIEGRVNGTRIVLLSCYLKKS